MVRLVTMVVVLSVCAAGWSQTSAPAAALSTAPTTRAALPSDPSTPRGAFHVLFIATDTGDAAAIRSVLLTTSPMEEKLADSMANMSAATVAWQNAIKKTFGDEKANAVIGDHSAVLKNREELIARVSESITGDTAVLTLPGVPQFAPIEFKKVGDSWKMAIGKSLQRIDPAMVQQQLDTVGVQIKVYRDMTDDILSGKEKDLSQIMPDKQMRTRQAMMQYVQDRNKATTTSASQPATRP